MMNIQKGDFLFIFIIMGVLIFLPLASAGFSDWFSGLMDITGWPVGDVTTVSIALSNAAPNVSEVSANVNSSFDPIEGGLREVEFTVIVNDTNGDADIQNASANFTQGTTERVNGTCERGDVGTDSASANFSCTISLQYFNPNGDYIIRVEANDSSGLGDINNTLTLTYNLLTAMNLSVNALTLAAADPDEYNITNNSATDFLNIENTGNQAGLNLSVNASDLGTTNAQAGANDFIPAENFTFANISIDYDGVSKAECMDSTLDGNQTTNLVNATLTAVTGIIDRGAAQSSSLYLCLVHVPAGIGAYTYDTTRGGSWSVLVASEP
ncbi:hypothetical protein HYX17_01990 [Candidatus Woesearchaeota archaeon]|nr:hypothetical protein [Candidatus Woesearchaeota archaeon]